VGWSKKSASGRYGLFNKKNKFIKTIKTRKYKRIKKNNVLLSYYTDSVYDKLKVITGKNKLKELNKILFSLNVYNNSKTNYIFKNYHSGYELLLLMKWNRLWKLPEFYEISKVKNYDFFKIIYSLGISIHKKSNTALRIAIEQNNFELARILVINGADVNQKLYFPENNFVFNYAMIVDSLL